MAKSLAFSVTGVTSELILAKRAIDHWLGMHKGTAPACRRALRNDGVEETAQSVAGTPDGEYPSQVGVTPKPDVSHRACLRGGKLSLETLAALFTSRTQLMAVRGVECREPARGDECV
jgi:hypothetical protein